MADNFGHSLLVKWDVLFVADRHLVEKDAHAAVFHTSILQYIISTAQEASKICFKLSDSFTQFQLARLTQIAKSCSITKQIFQQKLKMSSN